MMFAFELIRGALKEMAEWESRMRAIEEYESTTTDAQNKITRDRKGPKYTYEKICRNYNTTYTHYTDDTRSECKKETVTVDGKEIERCITELIERCAQSQSLLDFAYDL